MKISTLPDSLLVSLLQQNKKKAFINYFSFLSTLLFFSLPDFSTIALLVRQRYLLLVLAALGLTDFCSSSDIASSNLLSLPPQRTGFSS